MNKFDGKKPSARHSCDRFDQHVCVSILKFTMHNALTIPDILCSVFKFTDTKTDVSCVIVCKAWHDLVLDVLWYHVDRLEPLLKLLGPMEEMNSGILVSSSTVFKPYCVNSIIKHRPLSNIIYQVNAGSDSPSMPIV